MKIEGAGPMRLVVDDRGTIRGIWVQELEDAEINDSLKPGLKMFLAFTEASGEHHIPLEVFAAAAEGDFCVEKNSPCSGGGFFLMLNTGPGSVWASVREAKPKKWWQFWKSGVEPSCSEVKVAIDEIDKLVFAILMHVTKPRGLSNDHDVDFFKARCDACGFDFPSEGLSHLASRIRASRMGATVVAFGGLDVACPKCKYGTAAVTLRGMTKEEFANVLGEL